MSEKVPKITGSTDEASIASTSSSKNATRAFEQPVPRLFLKMLLIAAIVLALLIAFVVGYSHVRNRQSRTQTVTTIPRPSVATRLQGLESNKDLDPESKVNASVSLGFSAYSEGDYKMAAAIGLQYVNNPTFHKDITCNLLFKVYDAQHDTANIKKTADECITLIMAETPTSPLGKGSRLHSLAVFYQKSGNTAMSQDYFRQFVTFVKDQKLEQDEVLGGYYNEARKAAN